MMIKHGSRDLPLLVLLVALGLAQVVAGSLDKKKEVIASLDRKVNEFSALSDSVWKFAETALHETRSSALLSNYIEHQGFNVERGVAGMPTGFIASYGTGKPVIAILGEFDALPGVSQKAIAAKEAYEPGAAGHGCGHNLFGVASMSAAIAIKELIADGKLRGTVRFYGTPAEEAVGGKIYMVREGLFRDVDICLAWHPADETLADMNSTQALVDFIVEFKGKAAHAAFDPWNGRSALDALELFTHGINMMREHVKPTARMHYVITNGGDVPNVVPAYAKVWCWVRDINRDEVDKTLQRVKKIADGAALMSEVEAKLTVQSGDYEMLVNTAGEKVIYSNLEWLGPLTFTEEEQAFARKIQLATDVEQRGLNGSIQPFNQQPPEGGSTDVADVSWVVPTLHLSVTTAPHGAPWHAWPVVACGGMSIGHKGMMYAAKALAATMIDLFDNQTERSAIINEFKEKTKGHVYKAYIPDGPPPVPKN